MVELKSSSSSIPLTVRVVWAPQMILQPVFSIFPCSPLPSGTCQTPGLSIPWCCLPTSSSVRLVFFPLLLCLARWFWPDLMNRRHDHTTAVYVYLWSSGGLRVVQLPAGSWHGLPHWEHGFCMRCVVSCSSTSFPWLVFLFGVLPWWSMIHKHTGRWMWQGSASVVAWNLEKYSCHSKLVSTLTMLLLSKLSWRVSWAYENCYPVSKLCKVDNLKGAMQGHSFLNRKLRNLVKSNLSRVEQQTTWMMDKGQVVGWHT